MTGVIPKAKLPFPWVVALFLLFLLLGFFIGLKWTICAFTLVAMIALLIEARSLWYLQRALKLWSFDSDSWIFQALVESLEGIQLGRRTTQREIRDAIQYRRLHYDHSLALRWLSWIAVGFVLPLIGLFAGWRHVDHFGPLPSRNGVFSALTWSWVAMTLVVATGCSLFAWGHRILCSWEDLVLSQASRESDVFRRASKAARGDAKRPAAEATSEHHHKNESDPGTVDNSKSGSEQVDRHDAGAVPDASSQGEATSPLPLGEETDAPRDYLALFESMKKKEKTATEAASVSASERPSEEPATATDSQAGKLPVSPDEADDETQDPPPQNDDTKGHVVFDVKSAGSTLDDDEQIEDQDQVG